jgi:ribonuclease T1
VKRPLNVNYARQGKRTIVFWAVLLSLFLALGCAGCGDLSYSSAPPLTSAEADTLTTSAAPTGTTLSSNTISIADLPPEGRTALQLIKNGGPFPYSKDGAVFSNYEGLLPHKSSGYYHEYTVVTPGSPDRGARRIIAGGNGEYYYTDDHYSSFKLVRE